MNIDRRKFLKSVGNAAAFSIVSSSSLRYFPFGQDETSSRKPRVAVFFDPTFPPVGEISLDENILGSALSGCATTYLNASDLKNKLSYQNFDLFINPYGSAFPKEAFAVIDEYLRQGGNWLNIGGVPLSLPVSVQGTGWHPESPQIAYHKKLGVTQSFTVKSNNNFIFETAPGYEHLKPLLDDFVADEVYELYCRFTESKDFPTEDGSTGPMDAILYPLIFAINEEKINVAAPIIVIDRLLGACSGGRWVFVNMRGKIGAHAIAILAKEALQSVLSLHVKPSFACYYDGERPAFTVNFRNPKISENHLDVKESYLTISDDKNRIRGKIPFKIAGNKETEIIQIYPDKNIPIENPGLYTIDAILNVNLPFSGTEATLHSVNGFWLYNGKLLSDARPLTMNGDYFFRDGVPYPITGTTYMTSDVHRKFIFEPNPSVWNKDFQAMKDAGINMVRTGFWTGWKNMMLDAGSPDENVLRAMDAFLLTAQKHDIPLILTLFAFLPESWGGENAYLDPRSVNAQKDFVTAFAQRYKSAGGLLWDLINEPSFCNPQHLWQCRPNYDRFEQAAWQEWLRKRYHPENPGTQPHSEAEMFGFPGDGAIPLPSAGDFEDVNVFGDRKPLPTIDYHLFAQEKFAEWVDTMTRVIRNNAGTHQLITVGQDEGGTTESPSNHFFRDHVDFTSVHNWWLNDDLVWDNVVTGTPGKANLVEETGLMLYEKMDGSHFLTEEDARNLLERKLAIAFAAGGAGFVEWIWNTNPYMMSDNEAAIGLHRIDGTAKPEFSSVRKFAEFFHDNRRSMTGKIDDEAYLVIPHAQLFSPRNSAPEATKKCVRTFSTRLSLPMRSVSEYRLDNIQHQPGVLVCPSPQTLSRTAWSSLLNLVDRGSSLYISGPVDLDEHWMPTGRLKELGVDTTIRPVAEEEYLLIGDKEFPLSYRGDKMVRTLKAIPRNSSRNAMTTIPHGKGKIYWVPLPVELSDSPDTIGELYVSLFNTIPLQHFVTIQKGATGVFLLPTVYEHAIMCVCVSETDEDCTIDLLHHETHNVVSVPVAAQRAAVLFLDRKSGRMIAQMKS